MADFSDLKGIGPGREKAIRAMGIHSLRDLIYTFPLRYEDHFTVYPCNTAEEGRHLFEGTIRDKPSVSWFHGLSRVSAILSDHTGNLRVVWFNEPWIARSVKAGDKIRLYGMLNLRNNRRVLQNPRISTEFGWIPVYPTVKGVPGKVYRQIINDALLKSKNDVQECLPESFRIRNHLCGLKEALYRTHFPESMEQLAAAKRRIAFEQILYYLLFVASLRSAPRGKAPAICDAVRNAESFWHFLSFSPTEAQQRVLMEIAEDLSKPQAMNRLVQGDVGCGKTAVAFGAVYLCAKSGVQSCMMAPTEILARQHFDSAKQTLEPLGIRCRLLTGSTKAAERREIMKSVRDGSCDVLFGTHALITGEIPYTRLGLVITDEQHRFGVNQRKALRDNGASDPELLPHVLIMSATPIPRTLAMILYGDLDLSVVDEFPAGRIPVKTLMVPEQKREDMYHFIRRQAEAGKQTYIVCPLVNESERLAGVQSANELYHQLSENELKGLRIALVWGSQRNEEKSRIMSDFAAGQIDVLIATSVIEVGINNPNATVMIIENAERFGLSQLHQLRGRVGRGNIESWCFVISEHPEKLECFCRTTDGFELAQKDLELRGPGDLLGTRQSGEADHGLAKNADLALLDEVTRVVRSLRTDPALAEERDILNEAAEQYFADSSLTINA